MNTELLKRCRMFVRSVRAVDRNDGRETSFADSLLTALDAELAKEEKVVEVAVELRKCSFPVSEYYFVRIGPMDETELTTIALEHDKAESLARSLSGATLRFKEDK